MANPTSNNTTTRNSTTRNNDRKKASAFLNVYLTKKDGTKIRVPGVFSIYDENPAHKALLKMIGKGSFKISAEVNSAEPTYSEDDIEIEVEC